MPEFTDLSGKAWEAADALQGLWADAWSTLNAAANSFSSQVTSLKQELAEGKKGINTVVDEVSRSDVATAMACSCGQFPQEALLEPSIRASEAQCMRRVGC